jgi:hypothetical protein
MNKLVLLLLVVFAALAANGDDALEPFDATWTNRWWFFASTNMELSVSQHALPSTTNGYLDIRTTAKGAGYAIIQSRCSIQARTETPVGQIPIGLSFLVKGGKKGEHFTFEFDGNRKVAVVLLGGEEWQSVEVPFSSFIPPISYADVRRAGFAQIVLGNATHIQVGPIRWIYPPLYGKTGTPYNLELANFRPTPNLEYNPKQKVRWTPRATDKTVVVIGQDQDGYIETNVTATATRTGEHRLLFEVNGIFDDGGCPDWSAVQAVTILIKATRKTPMSIRFFRDGDTVPLTTATFMADTEFREVKIPRECFDGKGVSGEIGICGIFLPADVEIQLKRLGALVPEDLFQTEMAQRLTKRVRHFNWRREVLQARGLSPFNALDAAIHIFEQDVRDQKYDAAIQACEAVDRAYWYGIEVCALQAMNDANGDRAEAAQDQALRQTAAENRKLIVALRERLRAAIDLPSLSPLYTSENQLCDLTIGAVKAKNLHPYAKGRKFYSPSGKPVNLFGTHSFTISRKGMHFRPENGFDNLYKRLVAMGFNSVRLEAEESSFMPSAIAVDVAVAGEYREAIEKAWRYGLWVQYDNHFYFPVWVCQGPKEFPNPVLAGRANPYQNLEGTLKIWEETAKNVTDLMNIITFETPSNEPFFYDSAGKSILELPSTMFEWNQFLKRRYQTRDALNLAWTKHVEFPQENALHPEEDWARNSIQPPGFAENRLADMKNQSARIWDWLMFAKYLQDKTTGAIVTAVRHHIPTAMFMQQFMIGGEWDYSPIRLNYEALLQTRTDDSIFIGSHYGVGGLQVRKAVALGTPSSDSENQAEENYRSCLVQKLLDSGVMLFADYARWGGGMLWENDAADFKPTTAYVPLIADFYINAEPLQPTQQPEVVIIEPTRLTATIQNNSVGNIMAILDQAGVTYDVFEEHYLITNPATLKNYRCAIVNLTQANTALLDALQDSGVKGFFFGSLVRDAYCRGWPGGTPGWLVSHQRFIQRWTASNVTTALAGAATPNTISLEGSVSFKYDDRKTAAVENWQLPFFDDRKWDQKPVPGYWGELEIMGSRRYFIGDGWYRFRTEIPVTWKNKQVSLTMGAIDDTDETYLNGVLIGKTTTGTSNWWTAPRRYLLPPESIRFGCENVFSVKVTNTMGDAGIWRAPVALVTEDAIKARIGKGFGFLRAGDELDITLSKDEFQPPIDSLTAATECLAAFAGRAVLFRDGNWFFCGTTVQLPQSPQQTLVLLSFLKHAGVDVTWPVPTALRIIPFTHNYYIVQSASNADARGKIRGRHYEAVGMDILTNVKVNQNTIEFTAPKESLALIRVWN